MFVLNGSVRNEVEDLDAVESMNQGLLLVVVCLSDVYSELLVASEPLWSSSDEDDVFRTSIVRFEEMLESRGSETSRGWEDGEFRVLRRHGRGGELLKESARRVVWLAGWREGSSIF